MIAPQGKLVVMEVFSHKVFKAFRAADPLKSVQPNDKVWCFECHDDASALKPVQARTRARVLCPTRQQPTAAHARPEPHLLSRTETSRLQKNGKSNGNGWCWCKS